MCVCSYKLLYFIKSPKCDGIAFILKAEPEVQRQVFKDMELIALTFGTEEMARLGTLVSLPKVLDLIPSTHIFWPC